jgi:hypothetical protein
MRGPKPKKKRTAYATRERDTPYMLWCKLLPCLLAPYQHLAAIGACDGPTEADHAGERALGRKAPDNTVIPLCRLHHVARHIKGNDFFRGLDKAHTSIWLDAMINQVQHRAGVASLSADAWQWSIPTSDVSFAVVMFLLPREIPRYQGVSGG